MAFSDYSDSSDPCFLKARAVNSTTQLTSGFSPIKLFPNNCPHLEILKVPVKTSFDEIRCIFDKYGPIVRIFMDYKCNESSLTCYLTFDKEADSLEALLENNRFIGCNEIIVRKCIPTESEATKGNKRLRTDNVWSATSTATSEGWGSFTQTRTDASNPWRTQSNDFSDGGSRGRGRGRGGGRVGSRSCFNCGEEGHMSRECSKPKAGGGGRGGTRTCYKCGEEGHMSRECTKGGSGGGRSCFNCGEQGHMSRECPKPREGGGRGRGGRGRGASDDNSNWGTSDGNSIWGTSDGNTNSSNNEWATNETESKPQTLDW